MENINPSISVEGFFLRQISESHLLEPQLTNHHTAHFEGLSGNSQD